MLSVNKSPTCFLLTNLIIFTLYSTPSLAVDWESVLTLGDRPEADRARDEQRKPRQTLEFFGIGTGQKVGEFLAGSGYYTRILSAAVGQSGVVHSGNNPGYLKYFKEAWDTVFETATFANVTRIDGRAPTIALPQDGSLDAVIIILAYHDLYLEGFSLTAEDRAKTNTRIFNALKPGGVYGIVDHHAQDGRKTKDANKLHRIEESTVIDEITAAGFTLAAKGDFLRNREDDRTGSVFDENIRGNTDRFVLRFEKPE